MGSSQKRIMLRFISIKSRTSSRAVANPGAGARPFFLGQTETRGAGKKIFLETAPPLYKGLDDRFPPPHPLLSQGLDPVLPCKVIRIPKSK